jgi:glucose/arabinose dehydrogenase
MKMDTEVGVLMPGRLQSWTLPLIFILSLFVIQCTSPFSARQNRDVAAQKMILDKSGYLYDPQDRSCDGYPRLMVETMAGTCLGLVMPRDRALDAASDKGFIMPRTILQIPGTDQFLVVDMGGWAPKNGRLFLMAKDARGQYGIKILKFALEMPHGLALGPDGFFYIGERTKISKFHLQNGAVVDWQLVIGDLPKKDGYMHPLSQFVFDPRNGDLYINAGSPSDHCVVQGSNTYKICPEEDSQATGAIFRVPAQFLKKVPAGGVRSYVIAAYGLRNSMAMAISSAGFLVQGENSRDFPELEEPYEEMNVVDLDNGQGFRYGWPYCYNFHATSPEWLFPENKSDPLRKQFTKPVDCTQNDPHEYQAPYLLMPPHVAPLNMAYYKGAMFADLFGGALLTSWHGYQPAGQRLVAYPVNEKGLPILNKTPAASFMQNQQGACPVKKTFEPRGGMDRSAPYKEVISKWNEIKGVRAKGAPVGFTEASDGSLWIIEDRNRTIVRLARTNTANYQDPCASTAEDAIDPRIALLAWRHEVKTNAELEEGYKQVQTQLIANYCTGCHGNLQAQDIAVDHYSNLDFMVKNEWVVPKDLEHSKMFAGITRAEGAVPMPPIDKPQFYGTPEGERLSKILSDWIGKLPGDVEQSYKRTVIADRRNIRAAPGTDAVICGQFQPKDIVYIDPRPTAIVQAGGYAWNKVYLVPSHSRLFKDKCVQPEDGVFYIARDK